MFREQSREFDGLNSKSDCETIGSRYTFTVIQLLKHDALKHGSKKPKGRGDGFCDIHRWIIAARDFVHPHRGTAIPSQQFHHVCGVANATAAFDPFTHAQRRCIERGRAPANFIGGLTMRKEQEGSRQIDRRRLLQGAGVAIGATGASAAIDANEAVAAVADEQAATHGLSRNRAGEDLLQARPLLAAPKNFAARREARGSRRSDCRRETCSGRNQWHREGHSSDTKPGAGLRHRL